ncbi:YraN family protein [Thaumasiovibrio subtropicus]|uniref:YraN family protein n=1 Tax=Thaumasiovibrio subtropicus TaxID=1891207 RepID=UPI001864604B|nr:YraN family protein [Thaumasiovibrio subtropicus]
MRLFSSRHKGQAYEAQAEQYLRRQGLVACQRNFQIRGGEIDLIMRDGDTWVFIEVKYRQSEQYGSGLDAIDHRKLKRLKRTALFWLKQQNINSHMAAFRFDVVYIFGNTTEWLKNILEEG